MESSKQIEANIIYTHPCRTCSSDRNMCLVVDTLLYGEPFFVDLCKNAECRDREIKYFINSPLKSISSYYEFFSNFRAAVVMEGTFEDLRKYDEMLIFMKKELQ